MTELQVLTIEKETRYGTIEIEFEGTHLKFDSEAAEGEPQYFLQEGCSYQYEITGGKDGHVYQLEEKPGIIFYSQNKKHLNRGTLKSGIYVGTLKLDILELTSNEKVSEIELEIESEKLDYRKEYQIMLNEIESYYTELVLQQGSPVTQKLEVADKETYNTLYQKFSFVRSIVENPIFVESIHKIIANPIRKWTEATTQRSIVQVRRLTRQNIRQMASAVDRVPVSSTFASHLPWGMTSVPRTLTVSHKKDTIDVQENQFVKFVLQSFLMFCSELRTKKNCSNPLRMEVENTILVLNSYLSNQFFHQISLPTHMNLNSPVLQRKEGYREVLQAWLMFDLAAKLSWKGGEDIYDAGKKNVATLYEYWLFFKLMDLVCDFFNIPKAQKDSLITSDPDGIDLNLRQGRQLKLEGYHQTENRLLRVAFYYNRTFGRVAADKDPIHKAGSWSTSMRPDYTLSIWPGSISEEKAEEEELIVHIHFDAKYKRTKILLEDQDVSEDQQPVDAIGDDELLQEKKQEELGIYKRADLLKMHAYKDAIRRTSGAYVLYPGTKNKEMRGFHEIIPGLGAFCIRPGHFDEDSLYLRRFLNDVKEHLLDRTSEREKISYYKYEVYKEANPFKVMDQLPEPIGINRSFLPDETNVLIGYANNHEDWIFSKKLYNYRVGLRRGSIKLDEATVSAKYLLLLDSTQSIGLFKLDPLGPNIMSRADLTSPKIGYPQHLLPDGSIDEVREAKEAENLYLVYRLLPAEPEFSKYSWLRSKISSNTHRNVGFKEVIKLDVLMQLHE